MRIVDCFHALTLAATALWVSTVALDIDCNNNNASFPLSLNVSLHPLVRILNCSRRVNVNVSCGVDESNPMQLEVINGTTVPQFFLTGCWVNGIQTFAFAPITIQRRRHANEEHISNCWPHGGNQSASRISLFSLRLAIDVCRYCGSQFKAFVGHCSQHGCWATGAFRGSPHQNLNITIANSFR